MFFIPDYVEFKKIGEKSLLVVNNLNEAEVLLDEEIYINELIDINNNGTNFIDTKLKVVLFEQEILIDEELQQKLYYMVNKTVSEVLFLTILPTESCNFRCIYCYEDHTTSKMSIETIKGLKNFISYLVNNNNFKVFQVSWFGGEPLLCFDIINEINTYIMSIASNQKAKFSSTIITNAYLLNIETFNKLLNLGINFFQITVDGFNHDQFRILKNGNGTLDTILNNLIEISKLSPKYKFGILLRNNIMADNYDFNWYDKLKKYFGNDDRFTYSVVPVSKLGGLNDDKLNTITDDDDLIEQHFNYMDKIGLSYSRQVSQQVTSGVCYASMPYGYVIRENGDINKCTISLKSDLNKIGKILEDKFSIYKEKEEIWIRDRFNGKCISCKSGLICLNKTCPMRLINNGLERKCIYEEYR